MPQVGVGIVSVKECAEVSMLLRKNMMMFGLVGGYTVLFSLQKFIEVYSFLMCIIPQQVFFFLMTEAAQTRKQKTNFHPNFAPLEWYHLVQLT